MPRTFAIGDIHGCLDKLEDLLNKIDPGAKDTLIFLGDYIDRGNAPAGVIDLLVELSSNTNCIFLKGNHEDMFLEFLEFGTNRAIYFANGGEATVKAYLGASSSNNLLEAIPDSHKKFFSQLRLYHEDNKYIYVHAGIRPGLPMHRQNQQDLIWIRDEFIYTPTGMDKKIIFGHTPFSRPLVLKDKIGVDTGAVYGGVLTAIYLEDETFIQSFSG